MAARSTEPAPRAIKAPAEECSAEAGIKLNAARQIAGSIIQASAVPALQLSHDESSR
jgi:hypothetical protein